jgi:hypothetical protein
MIVKKEIWSQYSDGINTWYQRYLEIMNREMNLFLLIWIFFITAGISAMIIYSLVPGESSSLKSLLPALQGTIPGLTREIDQNGNGVPLRFDREVK